MINVCAQIKGMPLAEAEAFIKAAGGTSRIVYVNGRIILDNITKDYLDTRINIRVESEKVKSARIG